MFDETSLPGIRAQVEPSPNYVGLEVEEEPIVEREEVTDHQNSQPEETSEDESRAADESSEATLIPVRGLRRSAPVRQKPEGYSDHLNEEVAYKRGFPWDLRAHKMAGTLAL